MHPLTPPGVFVILVSLIVLRADVAQGQLVGTSCLHEPSGQAGRCQQLLACRTAMRQLRRGARPQLCGFQDGRTSVPNVCCEPQQAPRPPPGSPPGPPYDSPRGPPLGPPRDSVRGPPLGPPRDSVRGPPLGPPRDSVRGPPPGPPRDSPHDSVRGPPPGPPRDSPRDSLRGPPPGPPPGPPRDPPRGPPRGPPPGPAPSPEPSPSPTPSCAPCPSSTPTARPTPRPSPQRGSTVPPAPTSAKPETCSSRSYQLPPAQHCKEFLARPSNDTEGDSGAGSVARRVCRSHARAACAIKPLVLKAVSPAGGEEADKMEFPHMALLGYGKDKANIEFACGGSLISSDFILTAAHCRALRSEPVRWALLGAMSRLSGRQLESDQQLIEVQEVISHPKYDPRQRYHDIALLRLVRPAQLSRNGVRPACLHTEEDGDPTGQDAIATGWGATGYAEDVSENLIKVNLTIRALDYCRKKIHANADPKLPQGIVDTQLCAGGGSERDTCQGDSGGPLQVAAVKGKAPVCVYRIVGVVSFGPACGIGLPGVYVRVAAYAPWIESVVWPTQRNSCVSLNPIMQAAAAVSLPDTGPGTVSRRMCRAFLLDWCLVQGPKAMLPGLQKRDQCHYNVSRDSPKADLDRFPHMALLSYGDNRYNFETGCTASLIDQRYLLTTANCTKLGCLPVRQAILGLSSRGMLRGSVTLNSIQSIDIETVIVHPEYDPHLRRNDVALLRLAKPAALNQLVRPACLHTGSDGREEGLAAIATGWEATGHWQSVDGVLREAVLPIRPAQSCGLQPSQLCAGGLCGNDTYPGDKGSPLQVLFSILDNFRLYRIVGLASSSPPCGSRLPDVFTRVSHFVPWIESVVWPSTH